MDRIPRIQNGRPEVHSPACTFGFFRTRVRIQFNFHLLRDSNVVAAIPPTRLAPKRVGVRQVAVRKIQAVTRPT